VWGPLASSMQKLVYTPGSHGQRYVHYSMISSYQQSQSVHCIWWYGYMHNTHYHERWTCLGNQITAVHHHLFCHYQKHAAGAVISRVFHAPPTGDKFPPVWCPLHAQIKLCGILQHWIMFPVGLTSGNHLYSNIKCLQHPLMDTWWHRWSTHANYMMKSTNRWCYFMWDMLLHNILNFSVLN